MYGKVTLPVNECREDCKVCESSKVEDEKNPYVHAAKEGIEVEYKGRKGVMIPTAPLSIRNKPAPKKSRVPKRPDGNQSGSWRARKRDDMLVDVHEKQVDKLKTDGAAAAKAYASGHGMIVRHLMDMPRSKPQSDDDDTDQQESEDEDHLEAPAKKRSRKNETTAERMPPTAAELANINHHGTTALWKHLEQPGTLDRPGL